MADLINHPPHYTAHPSGVECITITEHMTFNVGNAVKYLWRAGEKGTHLDDLRKAAWYVAREITRLEKDIQDHSLAQATKRPPQVISWEVVDEQNVLHRTWKDNPTTWDTSSSISPPFQEG